MIIATQTVRVLSTIAILLIFPACSESGEEDLDTHTVTHGMRASALSIGDPAVGHALFTPCKACHGEDANGMLRMNAPSLVNQDPWYLMRQLKNFKNGLRGTNPGNPFALQMPPMAQSLPDDQAIADVVAFVISLPPVKVTKTIEGDVQSGREYYNMICGACHGPNGVGNEALNSPRLIGVDDWYIMRQLEDFQKGVRGTHPEDGFGAQMQMISETIPKPQLMRDVVAYLQTLQAGGATGE